MTQRQIDVLRWIGDGCPGGVMPGQGLSERITAGALRNRGLVTTKGRGPTWSAAITSSGDEYLARVDGPNPPVPRVPNGSRSQGLIDEIIASGGSLRVPARSWNSAPGTPDYERRVANAEQRGAVPAGKRLVVARADGELRIDLRDAAEGTPTEALPVAVPERVARYHRVVSKFRGLEETHQISRAQFPRACRILQGLVVEAEQRGYGVGISVAAGTQYGRARSSAERGGDLVITIEGVAVTLHLREEGVSVPVPPRPSYSWELSSSATPRRSFAHEQGAKGQLRISVLSPHTRSNRQSSWGDGKRQVLEDWLSAVLMEAETRSAEERERIRLQQLEAERRQRAWEDAMDRARARHLEHHRGKVLVAQVDQWKRAIDIRAYCDELEALQPSGPASAEWVAWARAHADDVDPTKAPQQLPGPPAKVPLDELKPFLDGWSPHGPSRW